MQVLFFAGRLFGSIEFVNRAENEERETATGLPLIAAHSLLTTHHSSFSAYAATNPLAAISRPELSDTR